jgi:hypothetical protein
MNLAVWSGPRNLSTALMYAFAQRADFSVRDEPFYAAYLARTGLDHPMRDAILASQPQDADVVARACAAPAPEGTPHLYLKLMAQHMVPGVPTGFMAACRNVFLIRHPARVLASYAAKRARLTESDLGFTRQLELFEESRALGQTPVVIDSADIRADPEGMLRALCPALDLPFDPAMLSWPEGGNPSDGVWAPHWYAALHRSTGFAGPEGQLPEVPKALGALQVAGMEAYEALAPFRLQPAPHGPARA